MARSETDRQSDTEAGLACAACGGEIGFRDERSFAFGSDQAVCWECCLKRGGRYDAHLDRWEVAPRVVDLLGESE